MPEILTPAMLEVLDAAPHIVVGVTTKSGTHATPELFTMSAGKLWCLAAATTLKAKLLKGDGKREVAAAATANGGSVMVLGKATVFDAVHPLDAVGEGGAGDTALATAKFVLGNAAELTGAVLDAFTGRLGVLPPRRVLIAIDPSAAALLVDGEIVEATGDTATGDVARDETERTTTDLADAIEALPSNLRELVLTGPASIGWTATSGAPIVLPGAWDLDRNEATVDAAAFEWAGAARETNVAVVRDAWSGLGPTGKQGVMVRGRGVATSNDARTTIVVDPTGVTYWDGIETGTEPASP